MPQKYIFAKHKENDKKIGKNATRPNQCISYHHP